MDNGLRITLFGFIRSMSSRSDLIACKETRFPRGYGRINLEGTGISSAVGFSGGPVFGRKLLANGQARCWLIGIQSAWDKATCTLAWSPFGPFGEYLVQQCQEA